MRCAGFVLAAMLATTVEVANQDLDEAVVVLRVKGCDYFLADGAKGLFLFEWYGGYDPVKGGELIGNVGSYGMKDVYYTNTKQ